MAPQSLLEPGISGGVGGIIGAILSVFSISKRIDRIEKQLDRKVSQEKCDTCAGDAREWRERIEDKVDLLIRRGS